MAGFPFHDKVQHIWKATSFLTNIFEFFAIFSIDKYMPRINYATYLITIHCFNFIIFAVFLDIGLVAYFFSKKRFSITWPLDLLKSVIGFFVTVAFMPITETLISIVECSQKEDGSPGRSLDAFPEITCWEGWHLFHATLTSFFNFLYIGLCSVVALTYFTPEMTSSNRTARQDSKGEVAFIINKCVCQTLFSFIPQGNDWTLVLLVFTLSFWMWGVYTLDNPYYDAEVGMFYKVCTTYYLWTNGLLLIAKALENTNFGGGLIAWVIGLPFLFAIMVTTRKSYIDTLVTSQMKFRSGKQVRDHIRYVVELIDNREKSKNSYMLLIGYVEKHKEVCELEDCYLKSKIKLKKKMSIDEEMTEICKQLTKELERLYQKNLKKFPRDTQLRLSYAFFLRERMKKLDQSLEQFILASDSKPSFDQQFIIYRYKKLIQQSKDSAKGENGEEEQSEDRVVQNIKFESNINMFEDSVKLSAQLHKAFWNELKEDNPDLQKLNTVGSKISGEDQKATRTFHELMKLKQSQLQILKAYANYQINIMNNKALGKKYLVQAVQYIKNQKKNEDFEEDIQIQPEAFIEVSNEKNKIGDILQVNYPFAVMFGYTKEEIQGKHVNDIIPQLYSKGVLLLNGEGYGFHDYMMRRFQNDWGQEDTFTKYIYVPDNMDNCQVEIQESSSEVKEQIGFGKAKNGYIFPITYLVKLKEGEQGYVTKFNSDIQSSMKGILYILTDIEGIVTDISASCMNYFSIGISTVKKGKVNITQMIPEGINPEDYKESEPEKSQGYFSKQGKKFKHTFIDGQSNSQTIEFTCQVSPITLPVCYLEEVDDIQLQPYHTDELQQYFYERVGYKIKLEKIENVYNQTTKNQKSKKQNSKNNKNQSQYQSQQQQTISNQTTITSSSSSSSSQSDENDKKSLDFLNNRNNNNNQDDESDLDEIFAYNFNKQPGQARQMIYNFYEKPNIDDYDLEELLGNNNNDKNGDHQQKFIDYGADIKTKRLFNGRVDILENFEKQEEEMKAEEEEFDLEDSIFRNQLGDMLEDPKDKAMFEREDSYLLVMKIFQANHKHKIIKLFKFLSYIWLFSLVVISMYQYLFVTNKLNNLEMYIEIIYKSNLRITKYNNVISKVVDRMTMEGQTDAMKQVVDDLTANGLDNIKINMELMESRYYEFLQSYEENLYLKLFSEEDEKTQMLEMDYKNAYELINTMALQLGQRKQSDSQESYDPYETIQLDDPFANTILYNYYNTVYNSLVNVSKFLDEKIYDQLSKFEIELLLVGSSLGVITVLTLYFFIVITLKIKEQRENVLFLFLDIPQKHIASYYKKSERFIQNYVKIKDMIEKNDQEANLQQSSDEEEEDEQIELKSTKNPLNLTQLTNNNLNVTQNNNNLNNTQINTSNHLDKSNVDIQNLDQNNPANVTLNITQNNIQNTQEDSSLLDNEDDEHDFFNQNKNRRNIIKKYKKNKFKGQQKIIIQYAIYGLFSIIFCGVNIISIITQKSQLKFLWPQYYHNGRDTDIVGNYLNIQKIMLMDHTYQIFNKTAQTQAFELLDSILRTNDELIGFNLEFLDREDELREKYNTVFYGNLCENLAQKQECENSLNKNMNLGFINTIQHYFNIFKQNLNDFLENPQQFSPILEQKSFKEIDETLYLYIQPSMQTLLEYEQNYLKDSISSNKNIQVLSIIIFMFMLFLFSVLKWFPYINQLHLNINRTIEMLGMIPFKVIKEAPNIRKFIIDLVKNMDKQSFTALKTAE